MQSEGGIDCEWGMVGGDCAWHGPRAATVVVQFIPETGRALAG